MVVMAGGGWILLRLLREGFARTDIMNIMPTGIVPHDSLIGVHQDVNTTASPTFVGLGLGTPPVANQSLTILGGTVRGIRLNQGADSKGIIIYGYDDQSSNYFDMFVNADGEGRFIGSAHVNFTANTGNLYFKALAGSMYFTLGDNLGATKINFRNYSGTVVATLDSLGTIAGATITGANVTSGVDPGHTHSGYGATHTTFSVYQTADEYVLTTTYGLINFTGNDPTITITTAGTYLILARLVFADDDCSWSANTVARFKLRRTNNTAADITNSEMIWYLAKEGLTGTDWITEGVVSISPILYTTTNTDDVIQLWGKVDVASNDGVLKVYEASIVAVRIA